LPEKARQKIKAAAGAMILNWWGERPREPSSLHFDTPSPARQEPRPTELMYFSGVEV